MWMCRLQRMWGGKEKKPDTGQIKENEKKGIFHVLFVFLSFPKKWNMLYCYGSIKKKIKLGETMPQENPQGAAMRKKLILLPLSVFTLMLFILCLILFGRIQSLNERLDMLSSQLETLERTAQEQQKQLEELLSFRETKEEDGEGQTQEPEDVETSGNAVSRQEEAAHKVYLTFDDGPSKHTEEILEILDRYDVKATFFVVGKEGDASEEILQKIVEEGHTLGMHSYSHEYSEIYRSKEDFAKDFQKIREYVYEAAGIESTVYRFPGGSSNKVSDVPMEELADYLESQGVRFFDWNVSAGDGGSRELTVDMVVENCTKEIDQRKTSVILMHDSVNKSTTLEALPVIIENILALEDTVILPITEETESVQHIKTKNNE